MVVGRVGDGDGNGDGNGDGAVEGDGQSLYPVFSGYRRFCFSRPNHKFFPKLRFTKQRMQTAKATHASESFRTSQNHPKIVYLLEFRIKIWGVSDLWFLIAFFEKLFDLLSKECKLRKRSTPLNPIEPDKI